MIKSKIKKPKEIQNYTKYEYKFLDYKIAIH